MINVLIVEDDLLSREMLSNLLEDHFPFVRITGVAGSVKESLRILENNPIDLLFLDIGLTDGNGFDILNSLKKITFEVIITTSYSLMPKELFADKIIDYLKKPLTEPALRNSINRFLQQKNLSA
jgi:response regulator of citrate/malate metabolism